MDEGYQIAHVSNIDGELLFTLALNRDEVISQVRADTLKDAERAVRNQHVGTAQEESFMRKCVESIRKLGSITNGR